MTAALVHDAAGEADHYTFAAEATIWHRRLAFVETTSARATQWHTFLGCPRTLTWLPTAGVHPVPLARGRLL
jgi:hypothetical protein